MNATTLDPPAGSGSQVRPAAIVTVGKPVPLDGSEQELMLAAAAGAPVGTQDPADLTIIQEAVAHGDLRRLTQYDARPATPATRYSSASLSAADGQPAFCVLRGDLQAVLAAINADAATAERAQAAAERLQKHGYRTLAVAQAPLSAAGEPCDWTLLGLVPLRAHLARPRREEAPTEWVYLPLWDVALRLMHWTAVACILLLAGTGYMIATPFLAPGTAAPQPYLMGYIRLVHYCAAWILIATAVVRIADLFLSPYPYARWRSLWPIANMRELRATVNTTLGYLFVNTRHNPTWIGLNPLQALTYSAVYGLALVMVVTGLAMYGLYNPALWPYSWFQWLNQWLGTAGVRTVHYIGMWLFLIFVPAHVYLSARSDTIDRGGAISSMINGGIWVRKNAQIMDWEHSHAEKSAK